MITKSYKDKERFNHYDRKQDADVLDLHYSTLLSRLHGKLKEKLMNHKINDSYIKLQDNGFIKSLQSKLSTCFTVPEEEIIK